MPPLYFTDDGHLPPGEFTLTLAELSDSLLVYGPVERGSDAAWDTPWRRQLVENLGVMAGFLAAAGISAVYIDGSFAEDKDHPNDIDGYFECDPLRFASGELESELNRLDPQKCWTWDHTARRAYRGYPKLQLPMWHAYRVELYPHFPGLIAGRDEFGNPLEFPSSSGSAGAAGNRKES